MPDKALHVFAAALANFHICFSFQIEKIISIIPACLGFHDALYHWFYASRSETTNFKRSSPSKQDILYNLQFLPRLDDCDFSSSVVFT